MEVKIKIIPRVKAAIEIIANDANAMGLNISTGRGGDTGPMSV